MKLLNSKLTLLTALLSVILWSCSDDMQSQMETATPEDVPARIYADFTRSYPDASDVTWILSSGYAVASFIANTAINEFECHSSVWYCLNDNQKKMHSTPISFSELPSEVTTAFYAGEYASLTPSKTAHVITRYIDGNEDYIYIIKAKGALDGTVSTAVKLYYTEEGVLVKLSSEIVYDESFAEDDDIDEFKDWLPQTPADFVKTYVDTNYPGARYLYIYENQSFTKVKILDRHVARTLIFDSNGAWISTATEIDKDDIPSEILAAFRMSEFAECHIDKITEYLTASDGHYYMLSLKEEKNKVELRIEADGCVTEDPSSPSDPENPGNTSNDTIYLSKSEIEDFILAKYPGASIRKYDYDDDDTEVEIIYNTHKIKVEFELRAQGYLWSESEWDFNIKDTDSLPVSIVKTISDRYSSYRLEYLVCHETSACPPSYEAGLKSSQANKSIKVKMDEQGNVIAEYDNH